MRFSGGDGNHWTFSQVEAHLIEAAWTLHKLPDRERGFLKVGSSWVCYPADKNTDYKNEDIEYFSKCLALKIPSTTRDIDRMEVILDWVKWLGDVSDRRLVMAAALSREGQPRIYNGIKVYCRMHWNQVIKLVASSGTVPYRGDTKKAARRYHISIETIRGELNRLVGAGEMVLRG